jgi:hypothetical protein
MIVSFSEPLALLPYLLRSLRIKKLYDAKEIYFDTKKIPKLIIWNWRETNITKKLLTGLFIFATLSITWSMLCIYNFQNAYLGNNIMIPNYNTLYQAMSRSSTSDIGQFHLTVLQNFFNSTNLVFVLVSFVENSLLLVALYY